MKIKKILNSILVDELPWNFFSLSMIPPTFLRPVTPRWWKRPRVQGPSLGKHLLINPPPGATSCMHRALLSRGLEL